MYWWSHLLVEQLVPIVIIEPWVSLQTGVRGSQPALGLLAQQLLDELLGGLVLAEHGELQTRPHDLLINFVGILLKKNIYIFFVHQHPQRTAHHHT